MAKRAAKSGDKEIRESLIVVGCEFLNVRELPSETSRPRAVVRKGEVFECLGYRPDWVHVKLSNGTTGFVMQSFIEKRVADGSD